MNADACTWRWTQPSKDPVLFVQVTSVIEVFTTFAKYPHHPYSMQSRLSYVLSFGISRYNRYIESRSCSLHKSNTHTHNKLRKEGNDQFCPFCKFDKIVTWKYSLYILKAKRQYPIKQTHFRKLVRHHSRVNPCMSEPQTCTDLIRVGPVCFSLCFPDEVSKCYYAIFGKYAEVLCFL